MTNTEKLIAAAILLSAVFAIAREWVNPATGARAERVVIERRAVGLDGVKGELGRKVSPDEVEVPLRGAVERIALTRDETTTESLTTHYLDAATGDKATTQTVIEKTERVETGEFGYRLRQGCWLDAETGKVYDGRKSDRAEQ